MSFRSYGPGRYLAGQEGFEPSTIRLTADRTTSVLLTLNAKSPELLTQGFYGHYRNQYCLDFCKPLSLRRLEYQTMRRRYQLGGAVVSAASLISPPRSFAFDVRAYMEIYTSISRNQDIYKIFPLMLQFLESPSPIRASLRKTFPHRGHFRTTQRAYGNIEYQHQCGIEFVERCLACCCNHNIV